MAHQPKGHPRAAKAVEGLGGPAAAVVQRVVQAVRLAAPQRRSAMECQAASLRGVVGSPKQSCPFPTCLKEHLVLAATTRLNSSPSEEVHGLSLIHI